MSLRAAIYARVSTDLQRDNYSIPSQIQEILDYAEAHNLSLVGDRFVDPETGKDTLISQSAIPAFVDDYTSTELSRPGLDAALQFSERTGFDVLLVHAIDRLARDPYFRQTIEREFKARGVRVEYALGNYDETPEGEVRKDLDATFAKWENAKRVERCNRGKRRKAEMGKIVVGKAPYGYRLDSNALGGLAICEPEAGTVQMIFSLFVEKRFSLQQIIVELHRLGIKSYHRLDMWAKSTIDQILSNTVYIGYFYYNKTKRVDKKFVPRDPSEWIKIQCAPIVNKDIFEAAQEILKWNSEYKRKVPKRFYMLTGMVFCADCGKPYVSATVTAGRKRPNVHITGYRHIRRQGHCCNKLRRGHILEPLVWERVVNILLNPQSLRAGYEEAIAQEQQKQARQIQHLQTLDAYSGEIVHRIRFMPSSG